MNFTGNRLLDLLGPKEFARLEPHLTAEALRPNQILQNREKIIDSVYFPTNGMVSIVTVMREGKSVEVGITGREGMVGIPVVLGDDIAANEAVVQFPGHGLRMPANVLQQEVLASQQLRAVLLRFVQAFLNSATQSAACNRAHLLEQRLARWLLTARDRTGGHYLPFHSRINRDNARSAACGRDRRGTITAIGGTQPSPPTSRTIRRCSKAVHGLVAFRSCEQACENLPHAPEEALHAP